jgi:hypothetical protein
MLIEGFNHIKLSMTEITLVTKPIPGGTGRLILDVAVWPLDEIFGYETLRIGLSDYLKNHLTVKGRSVWAAACL